jgi:penicillin-binding protein 1A
VLPKIWHPWPRVLLGVGVAASAAAVLLGWAAWILYQRLPDIQALLDYRPKQSLRVFTTDGVEIAQFGAERRQLVRIGQIPATMQAALLAIEDKRFRQHMGIDPKGMLRALLTNTISGERGQGASTITQQVARNFYLSARKTYARKINEVLLALKIEQHLSKDQILELYMNQIYLGNRSFGFEAAAQTYFGKSLLGLSIAECAMLAGVPQNPAYANPIADFERAQKRQQLVLKSMYSLGAISSDQLQSARSEVLQIKTPLDTELHAEHVAEMVRASLYAQFGEAAYQQGLIVTTHVRASDQKAATQALRKGLMGLERRQAYLGPEGQENFPDNWQSNGASALELLDGYTDDADLRVAVVSRASPQRVTATLASGQVVHISGEGLKQAASAVAPGASASVRIVRGTVVRVAQDLADPTLWAIRQWPQAQGALVSLEPGSGKMRALVGGFDFSRNAFNYATSAWRQPGSSFKPFMYSAALEQGVMPSSIINDAPLTLPALHGAQAVWEPQNFDGSFDGPISMRQALAKSKNTASIRLLQSVGTEPAKLWVRRFGFMPDKHPSNLSLALGSGSTTPMQLVSAYAVLASGGHRINAQLIQRIKNPQGEVLFEAQAQSMSESTRAIPARNAFITSSLLQEVARTGTSVRAQNALKRPDLYGKNGTTSDAFDAWFAGFHTSLSAVVWIGYDTPRSLGPRETGSALALSIWSDYMQHALKGVPASELTPPQDVLKVDGDWLYSEWALGGQRNQIGFAGVADAPPSPAPGPGL